MQRRELIIAGLAVGAAAVAEGLRPRRKLLLLQKGQKIDALLPRQFGDWAAEGTSGLVSPDQAGRLAKSLYSEIVERTYHDRQTGAQVMLLAAYGDTQSDLLQLHRPESCYPAVGFAIQLTRPKAVALRGGAALPAREVVAVAGERNENIIYWTRVGEYLPQSASEQRKVRLLNALHGDVPDGILMRCSTLGDPQTSFAMLQQFIPALLNATTGAGRPALVGSQIAQRMA